MSFSWHTVPAPLRARLLQDGVGTEHVYKTGLAVLTELSNVAPEHQQDLLALGCDMLLAAWEGAPLEIEIAATLCGLHRQHPFLPLETATVLKFCSRQPLPDAALREECRPSRVGSVAALEELLTTRLASGGPTFFLLQQALRHALRQNRTGWFKVLLQRTRALPQPQQCGLLADMAFAEQRWEKAAYLYTEAHTQLPLLTWQNRRAECLYRQGQRQEALELWKMAYTARPWQVNTLLRLTDVLLHRDAPHAFPQGRGEVLLYTWNKAQDMDATLHSLVASELSSEAGEARITVLDNGSTDGTAEMLHAWEERFAGKMRTLTLPVNVGAPAARNWLLALPETRAAAWAAFLDDDVAVPHDWLRHLWSALQAYPSAGVASGHALDYQGPMCQQWTDMHLTPLGEQSEGSAQFEKFTFSSAHRQAYNFGEFTFMRPCVTVIGCCHMFTRAALDASGFFDIRFSPSQSDDVDHDLQRVLAGHVPVYNGHLPVLHKRSTGYDRKASLRSEASSTGNWYKLHSSYSYEEIQRIYAEDQRAMWEDVQMRLALPGVPQV